MASSSAMELQDILTTMPGTGASSHFDDTFAESSVGRPEFSLPPVDGGKDAWLFLVAAFTMEALTWGE